MLVPLLELSVRHILIAVQTGLKHYHSIIWCSIVTVHPHILILIGLSTTTHTCFDSVTSLVFIFASDFLRVYTQRQMKCARTHTHVCTSCASERTLARPYYTKMVE